MTKILFETILSGHRMEYIHHLYMEMLNHTEDHFIIVVAEEFNKKRMDYSWPEAENVSFDFIPQNEADYTNEGNMFVQAWKKSKLLRRYVKKFEPQRVFLLTLMKLLPFLPLFLPSKCKVISIVYKIYLYEWEKYSLLRRMVEVLKYTLIVRSRCIKTVFILNDEASARYLNGLYHTNKFQYLVDPYNRIDYKPHSVRKELSISKGSRVFLHFGGLQERKGTMEILKALNMLSAEESRDVTVVFAGKVYEDIRAQFYLELQKVRSFCQIIVFDNYCSVEFLADLCYSCDQILIPYQVMAQSSGLLGYAAQFRKPVLGPSEGLIGKLIRKYHLGFTMTSVKAVGIAEGIKNTCFFSPDDRYIKKMTVQTFSNQVFAQF